MSRYPYTEAWDFIRSEAGEWSDVAGTPMKMPVLSRSQVSSVAKAIAEALGMPHEDLAKRVADHARAKNGQSTD